MEDTKLEKFMQQFRLSLAQQQQILKSFNEQIDKGLSRSTHDEAETKCFVTYVQDLPTGEEMGQYLALDLGGTNFRVLLVTLQGHHDANVKGKIYEVPKDKMIATGTALFDHIAECLEDFVNLHNLQNEHLPLGFTFSFPCVQLGLTKAKLVSWTKGFKCDGVVNEDVVRLLKEAIARRGKLEIDVMAVLNDTTGTLMSCAHRSSDCRIGVIIGTGSNACYVEKVNKVELLEDEYKTDKQEVIINIEWGAFGDRGSLAFIRTEYDEEIDKSSINVGKQLYEKMISGMCDKVIIRL